MKSELDFWSQLLHITGDLTEAYRWSHAVPKYAKVMGYTKEERSYIYTLVVQSLSRGFCDLVDIRILCEFFPHSCHKALKVMSWQDNMRVINFMSLLLDDLEIFNEEKT